jgi:DNA-binding transcriptional regulator YiaG
MKRPTPAQIAKKRLSANLTQPAAATLIHSTKRTWQDWEAGISPMHLGLWELFTLKVKELT